MNKFLKRAVSFITAVSVAAGSIIGGSAELLTAFASGQNLNNVSYETPDRDGSNGNDTSAPIATRPKTEEELLEIQRQKLSEIDENEGAYNGNRIVLSGINGGVADELAEILGASLRKTRDGKFATLTLSDDKSIRDAFGRKECLKYIEYMSLDYYDSVRVSETEYITSEPVYKMNDDMYDRQEYMSYLNIGNAWNDNNKGSGVTVAVIDTGIDASHSEFAGRLSSLSYNATTDKTVKDYTLSDGSYDWSIVEDKIGHGTAVAGVIAAGEDGKGTVGIAPEVNIIAIKAECDDKGNFKSTSDLVFAVYYAIECDVDIISMSFGTASEIDPFADAIRLAVDSDILCVAAAGNESVCTPVYPAANPDVISVGALDENSWELAYYSNYGDDLEMVAPGTTYTTKVGGYSTINGTSFACPIVSGALALYISKYGHTEENKNISERLYASCKDLGALGYDRYYGYGALDIDAFICQPVGKVTFDMLTDELDDMESLFIRNHTMQTLPEPERNYAVFDGWYYDIECTEELGWYEDRFTSDLTLYAKWVNEDDGVPFTYVTLDDGTVEIRSYTGHRRYITVPEKIDGKIVSSIGDYAFEEQSRIREINLPSGLTHIGYSAFSGCTKLMHITIPQNVKTIEDYAFFDAVRMSSITFENPESCKLASVGEFAFSNTGLKEIYLPASLSKIYGSAFFGASSLKKIDVSASNGSLTSVNGVLYNAAKTTLIAYPAGDSAQSYAVAAGTAIIGDYAFGYAKISEIEFADVTTIGAHSFRFSHIKNAVLTDKNINIGKFCFADCSELESASLGGITSVPDSAFMNCTALKSVSIPASVTSIGKDAFSWCSELCSVKFAESSSLAVINGDAFCYCINLKEITLPKSLTAISANVFKNCIQLSKVTFESGSLLSSIGVSAFERTYSLTAITLPDSLLTVSDLAFLSSGLKAITIPENVREIGSGAFGSCDALTTITVSEDNVTYHDIDGVVYTIENDKIIAYPAGNSRTTYTINSAVKTIGEGAFYGAGNLTKITLPSALTDIGKYGFYGCYSVTTYSLPQTLVNINEYAFALNSALGGIAIPDKVYMIGRYAFSGNYNMASVTFTEKSTLPRISFGAFADCGITSFTVPASVTAIAQYAFTGCNSLTSVTFAKNSKLGYIPAYLFKGCDSIQTITFESGSALTNIEAHGFDGMANLKKIDFGGAKVTNIDNYAFRFCSELNDIVLPSTVTTIGRFAFYGCTAMTDLLLPASVDFIGSNAFYPDEALNIYFAASTLPANLQENWDSGIAGYYLGVTDVKTSGDYKYAAMAGGGVAIIKYLGSASTVDLTALDLGTIKQIGGSAFYGTAVKSITLPQTLEIISRYAFANSALESVTIPQSVYFIGRYAFRGSKIASVTLSGTPALEKIEQYAFADCAKLTAFVIPASLKTLETGAFANSGLKTVDFTKAAITKIYPNTFQNTALSSVTLPNSVNYIDDNAFRDCVSLSNVTFGSAADLQIHANVFYNSGLSAVSIPKNVTYIGEYAFVGLVNLTSFTVAADNAKYTAIDGCLYSKDGRKLIAVPAGRTGSMTLPQSLEVLGFGAFENSKVSKVTFDAKSNILTLGYRCFYNADNLTAIDIPASVVSIDYYAFAMCDNLASVKFADNNRLTGIYEGAFYLCKNLSDIMLPKTIVEISDFAFYGCSKLSEMPIASGSEIKGIYDYAFAYCGFDKLEIPETVIEIGEYAFMGNNMTEVTVPNTNAKELQIGLGSFAQCNKLEAITVPFIGAGFDDMDISWFGYIFGAGNYQANSQYVPESLKTVTISGDITAVGVGAFNGVAADRIDLPESIVSVYYSHDLPSFPFNDCESRHEFVNPLRFYLNDGSYVSETDTLIFYPLLGKGLSGKFTVGSNIKNVSIWFQDFACVEEIYFSDGVETVPGSYIYCKSLKRIRFPENARIIGDLDLTGTAIEDFEVPYGITTITSFGGSALKHITIPDTVTEISGNAFRNTPLEEITLPESITYIGAYAFDGCRQLKKIELPSKITLISSGTFRDCSSLYSITLPEGLTAIGDNAFESCGNLSVINNNSSLALTIGSIDNGRIAYNANIINEKDGTVVKKDTGDQVITNDGFVFETENGEYTLISYVGDKDEITLPLDIEGNAYKIDHFRSGAKTIIIPEGFEKINSSAFSGNNTMSKVVLSDSVKEIEEYAFSSCKLKEIEFPDGLEIICGWAFSHNTLLEKVTLPDSVTEIGKEAFDGCVKLKEINVPKSLSVLGEDVFSYTEVSNITVASGNDNFAVENGMLLSGNKSRLEYILCGVSDLIIPASVTSIAGGVFESGNRLYGYESLSEKRFDRVAFESGSLLEEFPDQMLSLCLIGVLEIPENLSRIDPGAFTISSVVEKIVVNSKNNYFTCENNILYDKAKTKIIKADPNAENVVIPAAVTDIGTAFSGNKKLSSIIFEQGSKLKSVEGNAFFNCINLKRITLPEGLEKICEGAFLGCPITEITVPNSVTEIGKQFITVNVDSKNSKLDIDNGVIYNDDKTEIVCIISDAPNNFEIPETVEDISNAKSQFVSTITVPAAVTSLKDRCFESNPAIQFKFKGNINSIGKYAFSYSNIVKMEIPEGVTEIPTGAFSGCALLREITLPSTLESISLDAFSGCYNLTTVTNKSNIELTIGSNDNGSVAYYADTIIKADGTKQTKEDPIEYFETADGFYFKHSGGEYTLVAYFGNEETVTLPNTVNGHKYKLNAVRGLKNVIVPEGFTEIEEGAFQGCASLVSVVLPETVTQIGSMAFAGASLKEINFPSGLKEIGSNSFTNCKFNSIDLPDSLEIIDDWAFWRNYRLEKITIPKNVTYLGFMTFADCTELSTVNCLSDKLETLGERLFENTAYYDNNDKWENGCLYLGNKLVRCDTSAKEVLIRPDTDIFANCAFYDCFALSTLTIGGEHYGSISYEYITNLSDLVISSLPTTHVINQYFYSGRVPLTLRNVVLKKGCTVKSTDLFDGITGVTIYVEDREEDVQWDHDFPGWNNGNKVYYGGKWAKAEFVDQNGEYIETSYRTVSQIIRQPYVADYSENGYDYIFVGWDIDGDDVVDPIPATSNVDIKAKAVFEQHTAGVWVTEKTADCEESGLRTLTCVDCGKIIKTEILPRTGHTEKEFVGTIAPTCTANGYNAHICANCGEEYHTNITDAKGHNYGTLITDAAPTCSKSGSGHRVCSACGDSKTEAISSTGHKYTSAVTKQPDCTHKGTIKYTCQTCSAIYTEELECTEHTYVKKTISIWDMKSLMEAVRYIIIVFFDGKPCYYACSVCGAAMVGNEETSTGSASVFSVVCRHEAGDWETLTEPTVTEYGTDVRKCTKCGEALYTRVTGEPVHEHSFGEVTYTWSVDNKTCTAVSTCASCGEKEIEKVNTTVSTTAATCKAEGKTTYTATFKNSNFAKQTKNVIIPAAGHTEVTDEAVEVTCTTDGKTEGSHCSECGEVLIPQDTVPAAGHIWDCGIITVSACCESDGIMKYTCITCGETMDEALSATGHTEVADEAIAATCTTDGKTEGSHCSVCNAVIKAQTTVKATGHTVVTDKAVAATCTTTGLTEGSHCSVCNAVIKAQEVVPAKGHTSVSANNGKAATCTEAGKESDTKCSTCGVTLTTGKTIAAKGHTSVSANNGKAATCTEAGKESDTKCSTCGVTLTTGKTIAAKGHTSVSANNGKAATCTEAGKESDTKCSVCGVTLTTGKTIAAKGHTYGAWTTTKAATCTTSGTQTRTCSACGNKETKIIAATGHKYTTKVVAPTTTAQGYTLHTCSVCGSSYKDNYKDKLPATTTSVAQVTGLKVAGRAADALRISWTKVTNADGYIVEMYKGGKWTQIAKITKNTTTEWKQTKLSAGTVYKFRVKAYKGTAQGKYSAELSARTNPSKVAGLKLAGRASNALRIAWNKNTSADGYIVEMYKGGKWVRVQKIAKNTTIEWKQTGLAAGTAYKFRVKAYKMSGNTALYGSYTEISARTAPSNVTGMKTLGRSKSAVRFGWTKNTSADGYIVEMYKDGKWVRAAKIDKNSTVQFKKTGLKANTTYKFRIKAYKMSGKTALYSGYTNYNIATTK